MGEHQHGGQTMGRKIISASLDPGTTSLDA
jgi:hypothetical protein